MESSQVDLLLNQAQLAIENSYSPYSDFRVSAVILTDDQEIFTGTNIENMSYSASMCAERVALFKAVSEGYTDFVGMAIYHDGESLPYPCGMCLQVIAEFINDNNFPIIIANDKKIEEHILKDFLPIRFKANF